MSSLKTISFRIPSDTVESLDELAESMDRDRSHVLNEAVENYLRLNEHHIKLIKKGWMEHLEAYKQHCIDQAITNTAQRDQRDPEGWFAAESG